MALIINKGTVTGVGPIGKVVEVISDLNAVLVKTNLQVTSNAGGSSTYIETTSNVEAVVPAKILTHGSRGTRTYFNYEVGDMVYLLNAKGLLEDEYESYIDEGRKYSNFYLQMCFIVGSFYYTNENPPPAFYDKVRLIDFGGGNYIEVNLEEKTLDINFKGEISINGKEIYLNG